MVVADVDRSVVDIRGGGSQREKEERKRKEEKILWLILYSFINDIYDILLFIVIREAMELKNNQNDEWETFSKQNRWFVVYLHLCQYNNNSDDKQQQQQQQQQHV